MVMRVRLVSMVALLGSAITIALSSGYAPAAGSEALPPERPPIPEAEIPAYITNAVNSPDRPATDKNLDAGRKPAQMLAFFGIKPGMRVADIFAMGGWTTELLSLVVGPDGKVYSQNSNHLPPRFAPRIEDWKKRSQRLPNVVDVVSQLDGAKLLPTKPDSLDAVIMNMDYHDLVAHGVNMNRLNRSVYDYLKPGGVYGIIDNSAKPGTGATQGSTLHRIDEAFVVAQVLKTPGAHFTLAAASSALRNPSDDRTWVVFKHPGEQDRFMLKFIKSPQDGGER
jgi:predicted methyltransferase